MEIDDAPEEPAPPLGPGPKLGTVVAMVDFRPPAETGQHAYYSDHNARLEAQRRKADATERRVLETFYGVPASAWAEAAALPLVRGSAEQRMGHSQVSEWKKTLRVGDTIDVLHQGFWHEAVVRSVPAQTSSPYSSYSYASWSVGLTAFDGQLISCGRYDRPMAPRGMFVGDWRASLAVGDRVEARLDDNTWAMARVTAAADADEEEAKPKPAPARGGGVDICLVVIAGERFESSLEAGGVVNKGAEYRTLVRDTETFGSLRRTWAQQHGLQESELTLWSRPDPAPAPAPAPRPSVFGAPPQPAPADVRLDLESCARDLNLAGTATIVVTKNLDVVTTEATGLLELTVVVGGDETKLELPRSSPRLTRAGTHCKSQGLTKLKALELMGPPKDVLRRILYEYLSKKDPRRCHSGEIGTLVRECATQEDTHRVLAKLAEEFGDGNFPLPPLPDVEQAPLKIAGGALTHEASGLSTKQDSSHHYGYGSRYRDTNTSDAVSALLAPRGASAAMDIRASLGHVGLNWTPKRHGTVSPALAERIKVALLCAVRDRKRPHQERSLALLPNRILIHNIFSYLADVNSVRINGSLLRDETPPNGVYRAGYLRDVSRGKKKFVATPLSKLGDSPIGFLAPSVVVKVPVSLEIDLKPDWIKLVTPQLMEQANPYGGYARRRYSYTHTSNDASRQQLSTLIATLAHASADAGASVQEVAQSSILAGTPWASPEAPPAKLTKAAPHLAILEAARPSATAPMVPSPPAMASTTLRPYQRRALAWMIAKEDGTFNAAVDDASNLDPAYREFKSCDGQHFYEPRRRAEFERERPTGGQFTHEPGGILADEMGLGKTVVVAALLVTRPRPAEELLPAGRWPQCLMPKNNDEQRYRAGKVAERLFELAGERSTVRGSGRRDRGPARRSGRGAATATDGGRASERLVEHKFRLEIEQLNSKPETVETSKHFKCVDKKPISDGVIKRVPIKATLVVMPALLVQQWVTELAKHAPSLKVLVYEGPADTRGGKGAGICAKDLAEQDVVLMNFETLQKDLGEEKFASPLLQVEWWRMMTDEAQMCKTGGPEMAVELTKINRWAVTGTPLSSSFDDLVSQLYFIELEPFMTVKPCSCGVLYYLRVVRVGIACHVHVASMAPRVTPSTRCPTQQGRDLGRATRRCHKSSSAAGHHGLDEFSAARHVAQS